jgi:hypothetical protein
MACGDPDNTRRTEMTAQQTITRAEMDALVDGHYRAEEAGDLDAIVEGFVADAEHDVVGRPGEALHGTAQIEAFYRDLLAELRIDRFEPVRRCTATTTWSTRRSSTPRRRGAPSAWTDAAGRYARASLHLRLPRRLDRAGERLDRPGLDPAAARLVTCRSLARPAELRG